ncbi:hypothetical protein BT96DRAFT_1059174 [Gymnopus androsaceus JB14]|uniref:Uncharacterized protein n=1 Tax=Gymnopus androsaceus JB14 TaxID=1447944 RepID=A0A6A4H3A1_9AGAR|nr:hypothetical protein BT96DRAFT_1059174 [Gymnopus androsaceus JB14]
MPYDTSFDHQTRKSRTHINNHTIAQLKKLPLQSHLEMNKKVMDRNKKRREKALGTGKVLDMESLITIEDKEMDNILSDPDVFVAAKLLLDAATIAKLNRANREDTAKEKEIRPMPSNKEWTLKPDVALNKQDSSQPNPINFPREMFITTSHKFTFPLAFSMQKNISFISSNLHKFKQTCLDHAEKKFILDINNMEKKIKEAKMGLSRDNKMTIVDWLKLYNNYYTFEAACYTSFENLPCALLFRAHFNFFVNQEDSDELFHIWRPIQ